jgi:hypothetical protein
MQNVVGFYNKLPRGSAPEPTARGPAQWYRNKYFGKKPSPMRTLTLEPVEGVAGRRTECGRREEMKG